MCCMRHDDKCENLHVFSKNNACRISQYLMEAYSNVITLMHVLKRLCTCVGVVLTILCLCGMMYMLQNESTCKCDCAARSVCVFLSVLTGSCS